MILKKGLLTELKKKKNQKGNTFLMVGPVLDWSVGAQQTSIF